MLMDDYKVLCVMMVETSAPDGEGGSETDWKPGTTFDAAITHNASTDARAAEKQGVTSQYAVYVDKGFALKYHDVFKRLSDGKVFRVTSDGDDAQTPKRATFQFSQVTAEEYTIPDGGAE